MSIRKWRRRCAKMNAQHAKVEFACTAAYHTGSRYTRVKIDWIWLGTKCKEYHCIWMLHRLIEQVNDDHNNRRFHNVLVSWPMWSRIYGTGRKVDGKAILGHGGQHAEVYRVLYAKSTSAFHLIVVCPTLFVVTGSLQFIEWYRARFLSIARVRVLCAAFMCTDTI